MPHKQEKDPKTNFHYHGFYAPTTTPVPDDVFDIIAPELTEAELRVLLYIVRRTFGFKKDKDRISLSQMVNGIKTKGGKLLDKGTGMSRRGVMRGCAGLIEKGIITVQKGTSDLGDSEINIYSLMFHNEKEVGNNIPYPGAPSTLPVGNKVPPQETVLQETEKQQSDDDMAVLLEKFGISKSQAQKLATNYPTELIMEKLDLAQYLLSINSALVAKNPAGWLVRAIEQNYLPTKIKGYQSKAQREQEEKERRQEEEELERAQEARMQAIEAFRQSQTEKPIPGTRLTTKTAWEKALAILEKDLNRANFRTWIKPLLLIGCQGDEMLVGTPSEFVLNCVQTRMSSRVANALSNVIGRRVEVEFEVVPEMTKGDAD